jgi:hypothetical protein
MAGSSSDILYIQTQKMNHIKLMNIKCHTFYFPIVKNCLKIAIKDDLKYGSDPKIRKQEETLV